MGAETNHEKANKPWKLSLDSWAVVLAFLAIGSVDYVFTQTVLATHPALNTPR